MKVAALLWDGPSDRAERRRLLVGTLGPALVELGAVSLTLTVADEAADVRGLNPFQRGPVPVALVDVDLPEASVDPALERLRAAGFRVDAYEVDTTIPTTYGDNTHAAPFVGGTGEPSPGVVAVSLIERRPDLDPAEFLRRWNGRMSPVSEAIMPRSRYVRHLVRRPLTPGAPPWAAIAAEAWPSPRHVSNPFLLYGARTPWGLVRNLARILTAVSAMTHVATVRTFMATEWILRPPASCEPSGRSDPTGGARAATAPTCR